MSKELKAEDKIQKKKLKLLVWYVQSALADLADDNQHGAKYMLETGLTDCRKMEELLRKKG